MFTNINLSLVYLLNLVHDPYIGTTILVSTFLKILFIDNKTERIW